ncbi:hypothetical protein MMC21_008284 [Puttea exsequens]|nr:hypothetical protein [Puttea exsequens]
MANQRRTAASKSVRSPPRKPITKTHLQTWDDIPYWQQDNEFILSGYRPASGSFIRSYQSLVYANNETVNIYSHIVGAALFLLLPVLYYNPAASIADVVVFSTFYYGVATCFFLSSTYHIIANHSPDVQRLGNQLDYLGIVILMWGSTIPSIYYGFYCDPKLQKAYWANVSVLASLCVIATLHPRFRHPALRPYRAAMYAALGLSAVVFVVHGLLLHGWARQKMRMSLDCMGVMALFNLVGAAIYAARVPEKWQPLRYDIYGNSHQILHVAVVLAGLAHMVGLLRAFKYVHSRDAVCT